MKRRQFLGVIGLSASGAVGCRWWLEEGIFNPCLMATAEMALFQHELVQAAWEGVKEASVWDCHAHLIGIGDAAQGVWVNPNMRSLLHPVQYAQFKFYLNASCAQVANLSTSPDRATDHTSIDQGVVSRLVNLQQGLGHGAKLMLLAFDYYHDSAGLAQPSLSAFHISNAHAAQTVKRYPQVFEWIASVHPYRSDCVQALEWAVQQGARACKWLPSAMGIDPLSKQCDRFYEAMVRLQLPLLTHAGDEHAVSSHGGQTLGNPLVLRRALDHGVRVIFAHCASMGENRDIDKGANGPVMANVDLFGRLMDDSRYQGQVYGDISALTQVNRDRAVIAKIVTRQDWHDRLLYGSDYPLPGVMPLFSPQNFVDWGYLSSSVAQLLSEIRSYNPILFDFMLKRYLKVDGKQFSANVFQTRQFFERTPIH